MKELREAVRAALKSLEDAHQALETAGDDADRDELARAFEAAEQEHRSAVDRLERAQRLEEARTNAPVEPVEDTTEEKRERIEVKSEPLTYRKDNNQSLSFFRDLARRGDDPAAAERIQRHVREMAEQRDLSSTDAAGGELVSPLYLNQEFIAFKRAGRVTADAIGARPLPANTDTIILPKQDGGVTVAVQSDNAAVSETDATFTNVQAAVGTIAGMQDVSQQLLDRSVPGIDEVIFADLRKAYDVKLDTDVLNSTTANRKGITEVASTNSVTYTDASPTVAELYPKLSQAVHEVHADIYASPDAIIMHPRRWAWILGSVDGQNRPLVTPYAPQNAAGDFGLGAEGAVGSMLGLPVFIDPNVVTTAGSGTNEDEIYVVDRSELYLWEDATPRVDTFRDVGSGNLTVRFRLFNYWAQCFSRHPGAICVVGGTGLANPY